MRVEMLKSKIHRATITQADLHYEGSLTIDEELMQAADILPYEKVQVVNINNGSRLETYVIPGPPGSGIMQLNGAAARWGTPGDLVIVLSYCEMQFEQARDHVPCIVHVDGNNRILEIQKASYS